MLEVNNISKSFSKIKAIDDLSFKINEGEIVGLIGPNGSGKTTTIKIIAGLYEPSLGNVKINNLDIITEADLARQIIGYIPDEPAVYNKLTGDEFLHFVGEAYGLDFTLRSQKIKEQKKTLSHD